MRERGGASELSELATRAKRERRLPRGASCAVCGAREQLGIGQTGDVRCYSHLTSEAGRVELDHWLGSVTSPRTVIPLEGNAHRRVTDIRRAIGLDDLPPADGDPLLLLAHILGGVAALLVLVAEWIVDHVVATGAGVPSPPFPVSP
jgi:hypothetical protein